MINDLIEVETRYTHNNNYKYLLFVSILCCLFGFHSIEFPIIFYSTVGLICIIGLSQIYYLETKFNEAKNKLKSKID